MDIFYCNPCISATESPVALARRLKPERAPLATDIASLTEIYRNLTEAVEALPDPVSGRVADLLTRLQITRSRNFSLLTDCEVGGKVLTFNDIEDASIDLAHTRMLAESLFNYGRERTSSVYPKEINYTAFSAAFNALWLDKVEVENLEAKYVRYRSEMAERAKMARRARMRRAR